MSRRSRRHALINFVPNLNESSDEETTSDESVDGILDDTTSGDSDESEIETTSESDHEETDNEILNGSEDEDRSVINNRLLSLMTIKKFNPERDIDMVKCLVCQEEFKIDDMVRILFCGHEYHKDCVDPWLTHHNGTCPYCRARQ